MMRRPYSPAALSAALLPLLFAACSTSPAGAAGQRTVSAGESFSIAHGERVSLADRGTLRYVKLVNDSRCPPDVRCVWAGDAEVEFEWTPAAGGAQSFVLHTGRGDRSKDLDGQRVTLESLARGPEPEARLKLDAAAP
ncbi:hypothetical protein [Luteimonas aquatica]|uniref:hypothetical protein n=1 Tax=Luteimonas aquatica TaxID=450364 RepID=UPI001F5786C6|nr:hypothetical protein [Luteimonas aquatica]